MLKLAQQTGWSVGQRSLFKHYLITSASKQKALFLWGDQKSQPVPLCNAQVRAKKHFLELCSSIEMLQV